MKEEPSMARITRMKVTGRRGMGSITLTMGKDGRQTIQASGKMADLIARGMTGIPVEPLVVPEDGNAPPV
jgi:hypothetical protein